VARECSSGRCRARETVSIEGYLVAIKQEGLESPNCHDQTLLDHHIWIVDSAGQGKAQSMVVEITPRWGDVNAGWNQKAIQKLITQKAKFRVTGWLMFDQVRNNWDI
jgi:hypothetical protein